MWGREWGGSFGPAMIGFAPGRRAALLALLLPATALSAQGGRPRTGLRMSPHIGIGYVASVPTTPFGFSAFYITPRWLRGAGLYADVKFTTGSPGKSPYYLPGVTVQQAEVNFGDEPYDQQSDWMTLDAALAYAVTGEFVLYGGAGYSKETHYREFFDASQSRGNFGFYWVSDPAESGTRVNVLGGALLRFSPFLMFQLGVQSAPQSVNAGITVTFAP